MWILFYYIEYIKSLVLVLNIPRLFKFLFIAQDNKQWNLNSHSIKFSLKIS